MGMKVFVVAGEELVGREADEEEEEADRHVGPPLPEPLAGLAHAVLDQVRKVRRHRFFHHRGVLLRRRFRREVDDDLHRRLGRKIGDRVEDVFLGVFVEFFLVEGCGVEGVEELDDRGERHLDEGGPVLEAVMGGEVGHAGVMIRRPTR